MIVVTGATGNVGRPLVEALTAAGEPVAAVSRGEAALPAGAVHRRADLGAPDTLKAAFAGADRLFLLIRDQELDVAPVVAAAVNAGIGRIVLLSSEIAATREDESQLRFEAAVTESGLEWTILRPGGFTANMPQLWAESIKRERSVTAPFADVGLPLVDPLDIAAVAAAALTEDGHHGRVYSLTGPELVTPRDQVAAIADALGEPVAFVEQTREEAYAQLLEFWPAEIVEVSLDVMGRPNEAERRISPDVERVLGRKPHTFADWLRRNVDALR